jgi:hypothetical protein
MSYESTKLKLYYQIKNIVVVHLYSSITFAAIAEEVPLLQRRSCCCSIKDQTSSLVTTIIKNEEVRNQKSQAEKSSLKRH